MSVIYEVNIKTTEKENHYYITWHNVETNVSDSFYQNAYITFEDTQRLWLWPQCQLSIGEKLFRFLDGSAHHLQQALYRANQMDEPLELHLCTCNEIVDWPFELLAKENTFLLPQQLHLVRTISGMDKGKNIPPQERPLKLLFMASSAIDVKPELNFEQEEEAIFRITDKLSIDMEVEDSGTLEGLCSKMTKNKYDLVHLSGHTNIDQSGYPYFVMEYETGYQHKVYPEELWNKALIKNPPRLLFLSGCQTCAVLDTCGSSGKPENIAEGAFARLLIENHSVPAVIGWGRLVSDEQAAYACKMLFRELSRGRSILEALQRSRYELIRNFSSCNKPAWPMLRLFSRTMSLNAIVKESQQRQPKVRHMKYVYLKYSRVRVLIEGFVGRRRQLQRSLRALQLDSPKIGVILLGTAGLGKSCLAGKICERFRKHTLIIVHGKLNAITLENALKDAFILAQDHKGLEILAQQIEMTDKLKYLSAGSFKKKNYLLLLDDFEQNLDGADKGQPGPLLLEAAMLLDVLFSYLSFNMKMTQLIITSRYEFVLVKKGKDLVEECLAKVWLTRFREAEQRKKAQELKNILNYKDQTLVPHLLTVGHGNPRFMEWLDLLVGEMATIEVLRLMEAIDNKQEDFIREHFIRELLQQGGKKLTCFLRWISIYREPVMIEGIEWVAEKAGLNDCRELLREAMAISLLEHDQTHKSYQITPLLRATLLNGIRNLTACHEAAFTYYKKICEVTNSFDPIQIEEWIYHALGCGEEEVASDQGGRLINHLRERLAFPECLRIGKWILGLKKKELSTRYDGILLNELAGMAKEIGDFSTANDYYKQALYIWKNVYGDKHRHIASIMNNLGVVWHNLGDHPEAINYFQQALDITEALYGREHSNVTLLNNLGEAWRLLGFPRKAIDYYREALRACKRESGNNYQNIPSIMNNLGLALDSLGEPRSAIPFFEQALVFYEAALDRNHPDVARELNNLGLLKGDLGEPRDAVNYLQQALNVVQKVFGNKHHHVATTMNNLASAWEELGDHRKTIDYYQHSLEILKVIYGEKHSYVATAMNNLGTAYNTLGDQEKAIDCFQQAYAIDSVVLGSQHPNVARELNNLGEAWRALGKPQKALGFYRQALAIWMKVYGEKHKNVASVLNNLGLAWDDLGEHRKAIDYYQQALEIDEMVFGTEHPDVAVDLNNLGLAWNDLGEHSKAIDYYHRALAIWKKIYGEEHPQIATSMNNIGLVWQALGDYQKSIDYLLRALSMWKKSYGDKHPHIAAAMNNLGEAYVALKENEKAKSYFERAYEIFYMFLGPEHPHTKKTNEWLKICQLTVD